MKKVIGILGGIGPESSAKFYQDLIGELQNRRLVNSNEDYPHVILNSIPAPELVNHDNLGSYIEGIKTLEKAGAEFIVIICNTAYLYFEELQNSVKIPIIDLREKVREYFKNKKPTGVLILGSKKLINSDIFGFKGTRIEEKDKEKIDKIILSYNLGKNKETQKKELLKIIRKYNPEISLVACTELSSLLRHTHLPKIDTMDILIDITIKKWQDFNKN